MKASKSLAALALLPLAFTACSSGNTNSGSTPPPMESVAPATDSNSGNSDASSEETTTSADTNERGNVEKQLGEEASVTGKDNKNVYSFKVNSIEPDIQCTEEFASESKNGHLIKVNMDVVTSDAKTMDENYYSTLNFSGYGWKYIAANGTTFNGDLASSATYGCVPETELLPSSIGPGEKVTGAVILDLPATDGTLVYSDSYVGGWEYKIQQ